MLGRDSSHSSATLICSLLCLTFLQTLISSESAHDRAATDGEFTKLVHMDLAISFRDKSMFFLFLVSAGTSKRQVGQRIVGGAIPAEGKYPSLVRNSYIYDKGVVQQICAGSILNRDWIISSAHCFLTPENKFENFSRLRVTAGDSVLNETEPYEQTVGIERVIIHEKLTARK